MSRHLVALLGSIIRERRMVRLAAFVFFMLAVFNFTVGTWR